MILNVAQKCKKEVAYLLLFSFLNVMTFLPGSHLTDTEQPEAIYSSSIIANQDGEMNRSTVIELILEKVAGLKDCLPDSEKPDFSYHYFSIKFRSIASFFSELMCSPVIPEIKPPLEASQHFVTAAGKQHLPLLQHHNFVFRLTPF